MKQEPTMNTLEALRLARSCMAMGNYPQNISQREAYIDQVER